MIVTKSGGEDIEPVPAGLHQAILIWQVDIGSVHNEKFDKWQRKVILTFELPDVVMDVEGEERRRVLSKTYTASLSEKSYLCQDLVAWRGRKFTPQELAGFDLAQAVGKTCFVNVVHSDDGKYANIVGLAPNKQALRAENPLIIYDLERNGIAIPDELPDWLKKKIKECPEYKALEDGAQLVASNNRTSIPDDDLPPF